MRVKTFGLAFVIFVLSLLLVSIVSAMIDGGRTTTTSSESTSWSFLNSLQLAWHVFTQSYELLFSNKAYQERVVTVDGKDFLITSVKFPLGPVPIVVTTYTELEGGGIPSQPPTTTSVQPSQPPTQPKTTTAQPTASTTIVTAPTKITPQPTTTTPQPTTTTKILTTATIPFPACSSTPPKVYLGNTIAGPGGNLNVIVEIQCADWNYNKDLTLSLKIDNSDWSDCFLNNKYLVKQLNWTWDEGDCSKCKDGWMKNGKWHCSNYKCSHKDYPIAVFSNSTEHKIVLNFTCKLPSSLSSGTHTLTVNAKIYSSEIKLMPAKTSFIVYSTPLIIKWPIEIFKAILKIFAPTISM